jgi:hypothetical protein
VQTPNVVSLARTSRIIRLFDYKAIHLLMVDNEWITEVWDTRWDHPAKTFVLKTFNVHNQIPGEMGSHACYPGDTEAALIQHAYLK